MFELGREFMKLFAGERSRSVADGLTGGDSSLLELLDLSMLQTEARSADVAAGRIGATDKAQRRLDAAVVWREVARRSGDVVALRKAAATAETALAAFEPAVRRPDGWARARVEQGFCGLLGAELFGDPGLNAAAASAFREARAAARQGPAAPLADVGLALIAARELMAKGDAADARTAAASFDAPIAALDTLARRLTAARALAAEARLARADVLCGWGARLKDEVLLKAAFDDAAAAAERLDLAYEPLTWVRAEVMRGQALALLGEVRGEVDDIAGGASALAGALDHLVRDHSPLDWARAQIALARALSALGEASADERAFEQAVTCYDRADLVLKAQPSLPMRGMAAGERALALARSAELTGDLAVLDAAEAALKTELATLKPRRDPVAWALSQMHLARLYEARIEITGKDRGERANGVIALDAALDVFADQGLRTLSVLASEALERMKAGPAPKRTAV
jgi:hypothetical protein